MGVRIDAGAASATESPIWGTADTVADLRNLNFTPPYPNAFALTLGASQLGDGNGALYYWNPLSVAADDGGVTTIKIGTIATGRFSIVNVRLSSTNVLTASYPYFVYNLANIAALRANGSNLPQVVSLTGYYSPSIISTPDGGGGVFVKDSTDTTTADNGFTVIVDSASHRWKRQLPYAPNPYMAGCYGNGVNDDTTALTNYINALSSAVISDGVFATATGITIANPGAKKILFQRARILNTAPSAAPTFGLMVTGASAGLRIIGDSAGVSGITFQNAPSVRTGQGGIYVTGASITDLEIANLQIVNSPNINVSVYCGLAGALAAGSNNIKVHDMDYQNSLGDGTHVENADSDVFIYNISGNVIGDDGNFVGSYNNAAGGPAYHLTQTTNVRVTNIRYENAKASLIAFAGVDDFVAEANGSAFAGSSALALKMTAAANYTVGNSNGRYNITAYNFNKGLVFDTPTGGTAFNQNISGDAVLEGIRNQGVSMSNTGAAGDGKLSNVSVNSLTVTGGADGVNAVYLSFTTDCFIGDLYCFGVSSAGQIANTAGTKVRSVKVRQPSATATYGLVLQLNSNFRIGAIDITDTKGTPTLQTGVLCQSNTSVIHEGQWTVANAAVAKFAFGSNTNVKGYFYDSYYTVTAPGAVIAGNTTAIVFPDPVPNSANANFVPEAVTNTYGAYNVTAFSATGATITWGAILTVSQLVYRLAFQAS